MEPAQSASYEAGGLVEDCQTHSFNRVFFVRERMSPWDDRLQVKQKRGGRSKVTVRPYSIACKSNNVVSFSKQMGTNAKALTM